MKKHTLVASLAAMAIATSTYAQDNQPAIENTQPPVTTPATPGAEPLMPGTEGVDPNAPSTDVQPQTEAATPEATPSDRIDYLAQQQSGQWLATQLIGTNVENSAGENLGDINDLVLGKNGEVVGALVGVGGFLGIGEKSVAIPFENISTTMKDENNAVVVLNVTKEELQAAPDFARMENQPLTISQGLQDTAATTDQPAGEMTDEEVRVQ